MGRALFNFKGGLHMSTADYQPITEMRAILADSKKYAFKAKSKAEADQWQSELRPELAKIVGFLDTPQVDPNPEVLLEEDRGDYLMRKVVIRTSEYAKMPVYILIPKNVAKPMATVLAYAGHGNGVRDIIDHESPGFAVELCRQGLCVLAPEIAGFGERLQTEHPIDKSKSNAPKTCHEMATWAMMLGKSALGMRVRDSMRLMDYAQSLDFVAANRIGVMGFSGGGLLSFFHSCLDERVKATVVGGYFSGFEENILVISHCICNHIPNLLTLADHDDLAGLILPRPVFFETGEVDRIFQVEIFRKSIAKIEEICRVMELDPQTVGYDVTPLGHQISGKKSFSFLKTTLNR